MNKAFAACWMPRYRLQVQEGGIPEEATEVDSRELLSRHEHLLKSAGSLTLRSVIIKRPGAGIAVLVLETKLP